MGFSVLAEQEQLPAEAFAISADGLTRTVRRRDGSTSDSSILVHPSDQPITDDPASLFDLSWLKSPALPAIRNGRRAVRVVDLFAGCGGLSLGVSEACRALGYEMWSVLANDIDSKILSIYGANFPEAELVAAPIESILDGRCGDEPTERELRFKRHLGEIDLVIGGPPCQGTLRLQ